MTVSSLRPDFSFYSDPEFAEAAFFNLSPAQRKEALTTMKSIANKEESPVALKFDEGKAPMSLLSREALEQTAMVLAFGKQKYSAHNWRKGFVWSRPLSAAMRHLTAFADGEDKDAESGLSHLAHAMCCLMFLLEFEKTHPELDDRWKPTK